MKEGGEQFLNERYPDLQGSQEVESATSRQDIRTGEKAKDKNEKVEAYLSRLEEIFDVENPKHETRVEFLKNKLHENFIVKSDDIPDSYFKHQQQIARERGHGDIEITVQMREETANTIIHDQEQSLDAWVDYLGSNDATYPNWLKYFAFRSITKLAEYDKEKKEFKKRSKGTTAMFPDINREALAYVLDEVEKLNKKEARENTGDEKWEKLLKTANFGKLYAHAIETITPATEEEKENVQGEWVKYEQGSDAEPLYKSLQGHGTGWCTAGESVARAQLQGGDFYVFYSNDKSNQPKVPRVAIRMASGEIAEVRGVEADQNLESSMAEVAKEKMKELPGAEKYEKKVEGMRRLTEIEKTFADYLSEIKKINKEIFEIEHTGSRGKGTEAESVQYERYKKIKSDLYLLNLETKKIELTKEELIFLYEIDSPIEGFGHKKDPRIEELRNLRDSASDFSKILGIEIKGDLGKICREQKAINDETVLFVGNYNGNDKFLNLLGKKVGEMPKRLKYVLGSVELFESDCKNLGAVEYIGGNIDLRGALVDNIGKLKIVGGNVFLGLGFDRVTPELDFSGVKVGGQIDNNW